jgi:hypothetical protein
MQKRQSIIGGSYLERREFLTILGLGALSALVIPPLSAAELVPQMAPIPGIPGAKGFGSRSWGGNSPTAMPTRVALVSRLEDYGTHDKPIPGTLRYEVSQPGPRLIVLAQSGTIELKSDLIITEPYLTLTGHLASMPGIVLSRGRLVIKTHDVILSDLKIRPGDFETGEPLADRDCLCLWGRKDDRWGEQDSVERILINRCSLSFSCDELLSTYQRMRQITIQNCLMSHALRYTKHADIDPQKPPDKKNHHSMGVLINPDVSEFSLIGNVFAHALHRMPRIMPGATGELINNLFYGYGSADGDRLYMENTKKKLEQERSLRVIGNLWIPLKGVSGDGPIVTIGKVLSEPNPKLKLFFSGNAKLNFDGTIATTEPGIPQTFLLSQDNVVKPHDQVTPVSVQELESRLLQGVGARTQGGVRDSYDESVIASVRSRSGGPVDTVVASSDTLNGFPIVNTDYVYPPAGQSVTLVPPTKTQRESPMRYSPLEKWLWGESV